MSSVYLLPELQPFHAGQECIPGWGEKQSRGGTGGGLQHWIPVKGYRGALASVLAKKVGAEASKPIAHSAPLPQKKEMNIPFLWGASSANPTLAGCSGSHLGITAAIGNSG